MSAGFMEDKAHTETPEEPNDQDLPVWGCEFDTIPDQEPEKSELGELYERLANVTQKKRGGSNRGGGKKRARIDISDVKLKIPKEISEDINVQIGNDNILHNAGVVVWHKPQFHTNRYIFPAGYKYSSYFTCLVHPERKCRYINEIFDGGEDPVFRATCGCDESIAFLGTSASAVWSKILEELNKVIPNKRQTFSIQGTKNFGLTHPLVRQYIENLPNVDRCKRYVRGS